MNGPLHVAVLAALVLAALPAQPSASFTPLTPREQAVKRALLSLVRQEDQAVLRGDRRRLQAVFLPGPASRPALAAASKRESFLRAWARTRGVRLAGVSVSLRTPRMSLPTSDRAHVFAVVSEAYSYRYAGPGPAAAFGLGVRHDYVLVRQGGRWYIRSDTFTDPLDQDTRIPTPARPAPGLATLVAAHPRLPAEGASRAAAYADRFCGAAPGCGNRGLYNPAYANYNGEGGDCTNFTSQALLAGGLRESGDWRYDRRRGEGSAAWANAEALRGHLLGSGRAVLFAAGRYPRLMQPDPAFPHGRAGALRIGDLVSYVERGHAVHTAIVTAFDRHGVPLVDSHTSDRYHVPWDLGWDRTTRYLFWHLHYPLDTPARAAGQTKGGAGA
jgi:hypothetical protein